MSTFTFNFSGNNKDTITSEGKSQDLIDWFKSEEVVPYKQITCLDEIASQAKMFICGDIEIGHVISTESVLHHFQNTDDTNEVQLAVKTHNDLITGKYEGGLKIWECTNDLIEYLSKHQEDLPNLKAVNVLDLGCGAGILGIYAFMNGSTVTFQDYNREVLETSTIPNVLLNIAEEDRDHEIKRCKFYSGDWDSFNKELPNSVVYDVILTSETIYNISNYDKLIQLFSDRLSPSGIVLIAAKTYYFGVGGGTRQFEDCLQKCGNFEINICWKSTGGIQREILKISRMK